MVLLGICLITTFPDLSIQLLCSAVINTEGNGVITCDSPLGEYLSVVFFFFGRAVPKKYHKVPYFCALLDD